MPDFDEFGIPIKKNESALEVDDFGIPVKKKASQPLQQNAKQVSINDALNYGKELVSLDFLQKPSVSNSPYTSRSEAAAQEILKNRRSELGAYDIGKGFLNRDFDERQKQIAKSPFLQQIEKPVHPEELSWKEATNNLKNGLNNPVSIVDPQSMSQADYEKAALGSNPQALKEYRRKRQQEIDETITSLSNERKKLEQHIPSNVGYGVKILDEAAYEELTQLLNQQNKYKQDLKKSVADVATVEVPRKFIQSKLPVKLEDVGKEYLQVIGDPQISDDEKVLSDIERGLADSETVTVQNGKLVPTNKSDQDRTKQNINYKLYKQGASVMSGYFADLADKKYQASNGKVDSLFTLYDAQQKAPDALSKNEIQGQINNLLQEPEVRQYLDAARTSFDYNDKFDKAADQFPQVKRAEIRKKLNDAFFALTKGREEIGLLGGSGQGMALIHSIFGSTPSEKEIPLLASIAGVSNEEARAIFNERVKGFIAESPSGIRMNGFLQGVAKSSDETLAKTLMGIKRFFNTPDAETANRILNDRLLYYGDQAEKNKLRDQLGNYNINLNSIFNTMGVGIGQTAVYGAPTLVTGGLAAGLAAENFIASRIVEGATTIASGYAGSYEDSYREAARYTDDEKLRRAYANVTAFENAIPELFLSPADIIKKVGVGRVGTKAAFEAFARESSEVGVKRAFANRMGAFLKEFGNVVGAENLEEFATLASNTATKKSMLGIETTPAEFLDQAIETAITTTLTTIPLGIGAGVGANADISGIRKESLFEAGNESDLYKQKLQTLLNDGQITEEQFNHKTAIVNTMAEIVASVNKITKPNGKPLSYDEKRDLAALQFRIRQNEDLRNNGAIAAEELRIDEDNQDALSQQTEILNRDEEDEFTDDDEWRLHELENRGNQVVDINSLESIRDNSPRSPQEEAEYNELLNKRKNTQVTLPRNNKQTEVGDNVSVIEPDYRPSDNVTVQMPGEVNAPNVIETRHNSEQVNERTPQELTVDEMRSLPNIDDSTVNDEAVTAFNEINFSDDKKAKEGISKVLGILNNKYIPDNKLEQVLKQKSKLIGNEDYFSKDYVEKFIYLTTKNFENINNVSAVQQEEVSNVSFEQAMDIFDSISNQQEVNYSPELVQRANDINENFESIVAQLIKDGKLNREGC